MKQKQLYFKFSLLFLMCVVLPSKVQGQEANLKIHYTFDDVVGRKVPDKSGSGDNALLVNSASVIRMGKLNVLSLGNNDGYLDLTAKAGDVISKVNNYTISLYYRIDRDATISGNFLWSFSTLQNSWATTGIYSAYRVNAQRFAASTGGFEGERAIERGKESLKGIWIHVLYRQASKIGRLYINGELSYLRYNSKTRVNRCGSYPCIDI